MIVKETQNIFLKETSLTDMLLTLLSENEEFSDYIREIANSTSKMEDSENEW